MHAITCRAGSQHRRSGRFERVSHRARQHLGDAVLAAAQRGDLRNARALRGALRAPAQLRQECRVRARALAVRKRDLACMHAAEP